ncbi:MAG TPA: hypothetical protein VHM88_22585, partial [Candidatus Acidoferrales bacterium]|nr:hypothetical protein [Candidatus Acidoferrales bacterium]
MSTETPSAAKVREVMLRRVPPVCAGFALSLLLVPAGFADGPAKAKTESKKPDAAGAAAAPAASQAVTNIEAGPAPAPRKSTPSAKKAWSSRRQNETPVWTPMPGTSGSLGLFTVDTGLSLPARGFSVSSYMNKLSRNPGSVTVFNLGWNIGLGVTDWLTFLAGFEPYRHTHVGPAGQPAPSASCPTGPPPQLSLDTCLANPAFPTAVNPTIYRSLSPSGGRPGYVEDFPFVRTNDSGVGEVTLGFKLGILSELRGSPISLGVRNDFILPTRTKLIDLLDNGTQSGRFNYAVTVSLSKSWGKIATLTGNGGLRFTRDPQSNGAQLMSQAVQARVGAGLITSDPPSDGARLMSQANQARVGVGIILFPQSRFQLMQEYTGVIFTGTATPNTTFGPRDPVDGVWGFRLYLWRWLSAVDVGYRYMLNLKNTQDRSGFVVKLAAVHWPEKVKLNRPPVASCSAETTSVYAESGDIVRVRVRASDPDGDPLTYTWTATGG